MSEIWSVELYPWDTDPSSEHYYFESEEEAQKFIDRIPEDDQIFLGGGRDIVPYRHEPAPMTADEAWAALNEHYFIDDEEDEETA